MSDRTESLFVPANIVDAHAILEMVGLGDYKASMDVALETPGRFEVCIANGRIGVTIRRNIRISTTCHPAEATVITMMRAMEDWGCRP